MKGYSSKTNLTNRHIPAIIAVGGSLAALPAAALELGDVTVHSRLGQPLRASIAYALAPNEQISDYCVAMRPGASLSGLPGVGKTSIRVMNGVIMLAGQTVVREPMVSAHVVVNCPYSANLSREYMLFVDPVADVYEAPVVTQQSSVTAEPLAVAPVAVAPVVRRAPIHKDIATQSLYTVRAGENLSEITARIANRPAGLWAAVDAIFKANPDAFLNDDPNQLKAGSVLSIPSFGGNAAVVENQAPAEQIEQPTTTDVTTESYTPESGVVENSAETAVDTVPAGNVVQSGSIILDDNPFVEPSVTTENVVIPDTELAGPTTTSSNPNRSTGIIQTPSVDSGSSTPSWILWLAGSGIALFVALLMFGRRFRGDVDTTPIASLEPTANRRRLTDVDTETDQVEVIAVDYDLNDDSPTEENLVLDADVIIGTGLESGENSSVTEDFGFAAAPELDVELPFEPVASVTDNTDVLPPIPTDEHAILTSEVLPEDDDYDMSVMVDATKMPRPEDVTERDLKAVEIEPEDETAISNNYTITREIDYRVLEQDYEDEFTATQALNKEIARAAAELAERIDDGAPESDETTALPLASVTELEVTAQMPARNDDVSDIDDTGVDEAITVNQSAEDATVEMPMKTGEKS